MGPKKNALRALLLDDDRYALDLLRAMLVERYPGMDIHTRLTPDPTGEYDLFFLDDDFGGTRMAAEMARRIREDHPEAIVLAFSAKLEAHTLRELLDAGCNGVSDKQVPADMPEMFNALDRCVEKLRDKRENAALIGTPRPLFREWNRRLDDQSKAA